MYGSWVVIGIAGKRPVREKMGKRTSFGLGLKHC